MRQMADRINGTKVSASAAVGGTKPKNPGGDAGRDLATARGARRLARAAEAAGRPEQALGNWSRASRAARRVIDRLEALPQPSASQRRQLRAAREISNEAAANITRLSREVPRRRVPPKDGSFPKAGPRPTTGAEPTIPTRGPR
jgi:hypothetical protein